MKVIAVTGYKPFELGIFKNDHPGVECIKKALRRKLTAFVEDGLEWVIISGQLGVELWAAEVVFEIQVTKRKYESPEQFKLKNQFFIEKSDALLAVYDEEKPGSPKYIVEAAKKKGEIENYHSYFILFSDLQDIIEEEQWNNAE